MSNNNNENPIQTDCRTLLLWFTNSLKRRSEGRVCRQYAALYGHIAKVSNEEYHPSISNCIAQCITWYIQSTSKRRRKMPEFLEDVKRKLFFLRLYNQSVIKYKGRFPCSEQLVRLLVQYVVLEFEVLFCSPNYNKSLEEQVENRISRNLELILFDSCKHGILMTNDAVDAASVAALKVLTNVKTDHGNENKLYKNIINSLIVKFLKKIGMLTKLEEIVKNKSFTSLQNPIVQSIRQNLIANEYNFHEQFSISDDEYDDSSRSWDKPFGFESPKDEKPKLTNAHKDVGVRDRIVKDSFPNKKAQRRENKCASHQKQPTSSNTADKSMSILTIEIVDDDDDGIDEVIYLQPVPQTCKDSIKSNLNRIKPVRNDNSRKQTTENSKKSQNVTYNKPSEIIKEITCRKENITDVNGQSNFDKSKNEKPSRLVSISKPSGSRINDVKNKSESLLEDQTVDLIRTIDAEQTILIDDNVESSKLQCVKKLATTSENYNPLLEEIFQNEKKGKTTQITENVDKIEQVHEEAITLDDLEDSVIENNTSEKEKVQNKAKEEANRCIVLVGDNNGKSKKDKEILDDSQNDTLQDNIDTNFQNSSNSDINEEILFGPEVTNDEVVENFLEDKEQDCTVVCEDIGKDSQTEEENLEDTESVINETVVINNEEILNEEVEENFQNETHKENNVDNGIGAQTTTNNQRIEEVIINSTDDCERNSTFTGTVEVSQHKNEHTAVKPLQNDENKLVEQVHKSIDKEMIEEGKVSDQVQKRRPSNDNESVEDTDKDITIEEGKIIDNIQTKYLSNDNEIVENTDKEITIEERNISDKAHRWCASNDNGSVKITDQEITTEEGKISDEDQKRRPSNDTGSVKSTDEDIMTEEGKVSDQFQKRCPSNDNESVEGTEKDITTEEGKINDGDHKRHPSNDNESVEGTDKNITIEEGKIIDHIQTKYLSNDNEIVKNTDKEITIEEGNISDQAHRWCASNDNGSVKITDQEITTEEGKISDEDQKRRPSNVKSTEEEILTEEGKISDQVQIMCPPKNNESEKESHEGVNDFNNHPSSPKNDNKTLTGNKHIEDIILILSKKAHDKKMENKSKVLGNNQTKKSDNKINFDYEEKAALVEYNLTEENQQSLEETTIEVTKYSEGIETISSKPIVLTEEKQAEIVDESKVQEVTSTLVGFGDNGITDEEKVTTTNFKNSKTNNEIQNFETFFESLELQYNVEIVSVNDSKTAEDVAVDETLQEEEKEENTDKQTIIEENAEIDDFDKEIANELTQMEEEAQGIKEVAVHDDINVYNEIIVASEDRVQNDDDDFAYGKIISQTHQFPKTDAKLNGYTEYHSPVLDVNDAKETENHETVTNENGEEMTGKQNHQSNVILYALHQSVAEKDSNTNLITNVFQKEQQQQETTEVIPVSEESKNHVENRFSIQNYYSDFSSDVLYSSTPSYKAKKRIDTCPSPKYRINDIINSSPLQSSTENFPTDSNYFKQTFDNSLEVLATVAAERKNLEYGQSDNESKEDETFEKVTKKNSKVRQVKAKHRRKKISQEPSDFKRITRSCTKNNYKQNDFLLEEEIFDSNSITIADSKQKRKRLKPVKLQYTPQNLTSWSRMRKKNCENYLESNKMEVESSKSAAIKTETTCPRKSNPSRRQSSCVIADESANNFFDSKSTSNVEENFQHRKNRKLETTFKNISFSTNKLTQKKSETPIGGKSKNEIQVSSTETDTSNFFHNEKGNLLPEKNIRFKVDSLKCELDDFTNSESLSAISHNKIFAQVAEMSTVTDDSNDSYDGGLCIDHYDNDSQSEGLKGRRASVYDESTLEELESTAENVQPIDQLVYISIPETEKNAANEDLLLKQVEEFHDNLEQITDETETLKKDRITNSESMPEEVLQKTPENVEESMDTVEQELDKDVAFTTSRPDTSTDGLSYNKILNKETVQINSITTSSSSSEFEEQNLVKEFKVQVGNSFLIENILKPEVPRFEKQNENNLINDKEKQNDKPLENTSDTVAVQVAIDLSVRKDEPFEIVTETTLPNQENEMNQIYEDIKTKKEAAWPPKLRSKMLLKKDDVPVTSIDEDTHSSIRTKAELKLYDKFSLLPYVRLEKIDTIKEMEAIKALAYNEKNHLTSKDPELNNIIKEKNLEVISDNIKHDSGKRKSSIRARSCSSEFKSINKATILIENGNDNTFKMTLRTRSKSYDLFESRNVNANNNMIPEVRKKKRNVTNEACHNYLIEDNCKSIKIKENEKQENNLVVHTDNIIIKDQFSPFTNCEENNVSNENQFQQTLTIDEIKENVIDKNSKSPRGDNNYDSKLLINQDLPINEKQDDSNENKNKLECNKVKQNKEKKQQNKRTKRLKCPLKKVRKEFKAKKRLKLQDMNHIIVKKRINKKYKKTKKFLLTERKTIQETIDQKKEEIIKLDLTKINESTVEIRAFDNQPTEKQSGMVHEPITSKAKGIIHENNLEREETSSQKNTYVNLDTRKPDFMENITDNGKESNKEEKNHIENKDNSPGNCTVSIDNTTLEDNKTVTCSPQDESLNLEIKEKINEEDNLHLLQHKTNGNVEYINLPSPEHEEIIVDKSESSNNQIEKDMPFLRTEFSLKIQALFDLFTPKKTLEQDELRARCDSPHLSLKPYLSITKMFKSPKFPKNSLKVFLSDFPYSNIIRNSRKTRKFGKRSVEATVSYLKERHENIFFSRIQTSDLDFTSFKDNLLYRLNQRNEPEKSDETKILNPVCPEKPSNLQKLEFKECQNPSGGCKHEETKNESASFEESKDEVVNSITVTKIIDESITANPSEETSPEPLKLSSETEIPPPICDFLKLHNENLTETSNKLIPSVPDGFIQGYNETPVSECPTVPTLCGDEISMNFITEITTTLAPHVVTQKDSSGICSSVDNLGTQPSTSRAGLVDTTRDETYVSQHVNVYWTIQTSSETLDHNYSAGDPLLCDKSKSNNVPPCNPNNERVEAAETSRQLDSSPDATETIFPFPEEVCIDSVIANQTNNSELEFNYTDNTLTEESSVGQINQYTINNLKQEQIEESSSDTPLSMKVFNENEYNGYIETPIMSLDIMNKLMDGNQSPDDVTNFLDNLNNSGITPACAPQEIESSTNVILTPPGSDEMENGSVNLQDNIFPLVNCTFTDIETYNFLKDFLPTTESSNNTSKLPGNSSSNITNLLSPSPVSVVSTIETIPANSTNDSNVEQLPDNTKKIFNYPNKKVVVEQVKQYPVAEVTALPENPFSEFKKLENERKTYSNPLIHNEISKTGIRRVAYTKVKAPDKKSINLKCANQNAKTEQEVLETTSSCSSIDSSPNPTNDRIERLQGEGIETNKVENPEKEKDQKSNYLQESTDKTDVDKDTSFLQTRSNIENGRTCPDEPQNATTIKKQNDSSEKQLVAEVSSKEFDMTDKYSVVKLQKRASTIKTSQSTANYENKTSSRSRSRSKNPKQSKANVTTADSTGKSRGKRAALPLKEDSSNDSSYTPKRSKKTATDMKQQSQNFVDTSDKNSNSSRESSSDGSPVYLLNQVDTESLKMTLKRLDDPTETVPNKKRKLNVQNPQDMDIIFNRLLQESDVNAFVKTKKELSSSPKSSSSANNKSKPTLNSSQEEEEAHNNISELDDKRSGYKTDSASTGDSISSRYHSPPELDARNRKDSRLLKAPSSSDEKIRRDSNGLKSYSTSGAAAAYNAGTDKNVKRELTLPRGHHGCSGSTSNPLRGSTNSRRCSSTTRSNPSPNIHHTTTRDEKIKRELFTNAKNHTSRNSLHNLGLDERIRRELGISKNYPTDPPRYSGSYDKHRPGDPNFPKNQGDDKNRSSKGHVPFDPVRNSSSYNNLRSGDPSFSKNRGNDKNRSFKGHVPFDPVRNSSSYDKSRSGNSNYPKNPLSASDSTRNSYPQRDSRSHQSTNNPYFLTQIDIDKDRASRKSTTYNGSSGRQHPPYYNNPDQQKYPKFNGSSGSSGSSKSGISSSRSYDREVRSHQDSKLNGHQSKSDGSYTSSQKDNPEYCYLTNIRLGKPQKPQASSRDHSLWLPLSSLLPEPKVSFEPMQETTKNKDAKKS